MPRPHPIQPDPDPDGVWPSCDEEQPGISIRPFSQTELQALLAHLTHDYDQDEQPDQHQGEGFRVGPAGRPPAAGGPVVAVRVRASVGHPGASAQTEYRRRRTAERARWTHSLPWRAAAILAGGLGAGLLAGRLLPPLAGLVGLAAAACLAWALRFRPSPDTLAWRRGAKGSGAPPACSPPWSATAGRSCMTWPSPTRRPTSTIWSSAPAAYLPSTPSGIGGGCGSTPLGCCGMVATCCWPPCGACCGRPTRPTRFSASPRSKSPPLWPSTALLFHGAAWRSTASPSSPPGGCRICCGRCRRSSGLSGWPGWLIERGSGSGRRREAHGEVEMLGRGGPG
jgi:hypothetical protein